MRRINSGAFLKFVKSIQPLFGNEYAGILNCDDRLATFLERFRWRHVHVSTSRLLGLSKTFNSCLETKVWESFMANAKAVITKIVAYGNQSAGHFQAVKRILFSWEICTIITEIVNQGILHGQNSHYRDRCAREPIYWTVSSHEKHFV